MAAKPTYWIGPRPSDGRRWANTTVATVLTGDEEKEAIYRMYRRYVKQWNDIELNNDRCLSEHTHEICGAKVVGSGNRRFILHWYGGDQFTGFLKSCLREASESITRASRVVVTPSDQPKTFAPFAFTGTKAAEKNSASG